MFDFHDFNSSFNSLFILWTLFGFIAFIYIMIFC